MQNSVVSLPVAGVAVAAVGLAVVTVMIMAMAREAVVSCECDGNVAHPQAARWCFQGRERLAWLGRLAAPTWICRRYGQLWQIG